MAESSNPEAPQTAPHWGWMVGLGVLMLLLGLVGMVMAGILTLASVLFFGILLLIGGGVQMAHAVSCRGCGWRPIASYVVMALLYLATGLLILVDPLTASLGLTLFLAGLLAAIGVVRIVFAIQNRGDGPWAWPLLGGLLSVALGVLIFLQWPLSGLWVIGLFVAIEMAIQGSTLIAVGLGLRRAERFGDQATA